ncbi:MAG: hypothetical protein NVS3B16_08810 [Vulcanimicrobiaceae bacterium]
MLKRLLASVVVFVFVPASLLPAYAQADPGYKLGDRVEADGTTMSHFRKATVIGVVQNGYLVLFDGPFPRSGAVVNYSPSASRRLNEKAVDVPPGCPAIGPSQREMQAVATCWDASARRAAQPNGQPPRSVAAQQPAGQAKTETKTVTNYEAEAAAHEAEAARLLAKNGQHVAAAQPRNVADHRGQLGAATSPHNPSGAVACPASSAGRSPNRVEQRFRDAVVAHNAHPVHPGEPDGAKTVVIRSFTLGQARPWNALDAYSQAGSVIYEGRMSVVECIDYTGSIELITRTQNQNCFVNKVGTATCEATASGSDIPRDRIEQISKH